MVGSSKDEVIRAMDVDKDGNTYITGLYSTDFDADPGPGEFIVDHSGIWPHTYVAKYSPSGSLIWARGYGQEESNCGYDIAVSADGNIHVAGYFFGTIDMDAGPGTVALSSVGLCDGYTMKLDASGNALWAKGFGASGDDNPDAVAIDKAGNVYTSGTFFYAVDFDPGAGVHNLVSNGCFDFFVQKLDKDGNFVWAFSVGSPECYDDALDIKFDKDDNFYLAGGFALSADFDPGSGEYLLTSNGIGYTTNLYLAKYTSAGSLLWAKSVGGKKGASAEAISLDAQDNILITGSFMDTCDLDPGSAVYQVVSRGQYDVCVLKLDKNGNFVFGGSVGSRDWEYAKGITTDKAGNIYFTGSFEGEADFDPSPNLKYLRKSAGYTDAFMVKLDSDGDFKGVRQIAGTGGETYSDLQGDPAGGIVVSGSSSSTNFDLDPGAGVQMESSKGLSEILLTRFGACDTNYATTSVTTCEKYTVPSGKYTVMVDGEYNDTIPSASGCDSILTIHLTLKRNSYSDREVTACKQYRGPSGKYYTVSGVYKDTIASSNGCDSVITINLTINRETERLEISTSSCGNFKSPSGKYTYTTSGTYQDTIPSKFNCDSIIIIHLTIESNGITLYGASPGGGDGVGAIFSQPTCSESGDQVNLEVGVVGKYPRNTGLSAYNGLLYGTTTSGGKYEAGVLFSYDPEEKIYKKLYDFDPLKGKTPSSTLLLKGGLFYGSCAEGGLYGRGSLFTFNPESGVYTSIENFRSGSEFAYRPAGNLVIVGEWLFGTATYGGPSGGGSVFRYNLTAGILSTINFTAQTGKYPVGGLVEAGGVLYGTTTEGGENGAGNLFKFDPASFEITQMLSFTSGQHGSKPWGSLCVASNGNLYGATASGGGSDAGTFYEIIMPAGEFGRIKFLTAINGKNSYGGVLEAKNGWIYGTTMGGGGWNNGILFRFHPEMDEFQSFRSFYASLYGSAPYCNLIDHKGLLYGMASTGGIAGAGTLFEYHYGYEQFENIMSFGTAKSLYNPNSISAASNGLLYGLNYSGGPDQYGGIYAYDPGSKIYRDVLQFNGIDAKNALGSLIEGPDKKLYGTSNAGGGGNGSVFVFNPLTEKVEKSVGIFPLGNQIIAPMVFHPTLGKFYGTTAFGGPDNKGIIFSYDTAANKVNKIVDMNGDLGCQVQGKMALADNGKLLGLAFGCASGYGSLFEFDPSAGTVIKLKTLDAFTMGQNPYGGLIKAANGKFYGMTYSGGSLVAGAIIEYDYVADQLVIVYNFGTGTTIVSGARPRGDLYEGSNGKLYGGATVGGASQGGLLFEFDVNTRQFRIIRSFNGANGTAMNYNSVVEVKNCALTAEITRKDSASCYNSNDGLAIVTPYGTLPFTYQWYNSTSTDSTASDLKPGENIVRVTDGAGCMVMAKVNVEAPDMKPVELGKLGMVCMNVPPFVLTQGSPSGGTYSGKGVSNNSFNPVVAGEGQHRIYYSVSDGLCTYTDSAFITVDGCVGIEESVAVDIRISPVPFSQAFQIQTSSGIQEVLLYDAVGRKILRLMPNSDFVNVEAGTMVPGTYTVRIKTKEGYSFRKLIKVN